MIRGAPTSTHCHRFSWMIVYGKSQVNGKQCMIFGFWDGHGENLATFFLETKNMDTVTPFKLPPWYWTFLKTYIMSLYTVSYIDDPRDDSQGKVSSSFRETCHLFRHSACWTSFSTSVTLMAGWISLRFFIPQAW